MPMNVSGEADVREAAMAICAETCAFMGEPPCWQVKDDQGNDLPWPPVTCDSPGCMALAARAVDALTIGD
jgi:hypothetical protein